MDPKLVFLCSACGGINRIDAAHVGRSPRCGRCKAALDVTAHPAEVDDDRLDALVKQSPVPVLVDFWAPWCGPCRTVAPHLVALAQRHAGRMLVVKVNTDEATRTAGRLQVRSIPTLAVWRSGDLVKIQAGAMMGPALEAFVAPALT